MKKTCSAMIGLVVTGMILSSCIKKEEVFISEQSEAGSFVSVISFSSKDLFGASSPKLCFTSLEDRKDEVRIAKDKVSEKWIKDCLRDSGASIYALDGR